MQQAIYSSIRIQNTNTAGVCAPKAAGLLRWVARKWDLVGVLALMGSSAVYSAVALTHLGL